MWVIDNSISTNSCVSFCLLQLLLLLMMMMMTVTHRRSSVVYWYNKIRLRRGGQLQCIFVIDITTCSEVSV